VALVDAMGAVRPKSVIDLGCGAGALSSAAARRWSKAQLVTVDIDRHAKSSIEAALATSARGRHEHFVLDALDPDLPNKILRNRKQFDASICNPPYSSAPWKRAYQKILDEAGLPVPRSQLNEFGSEAIFIAQNLRLTKSYGKIGLIVPDWVITGSRSADLRRTLLTEHGLETVIQVPPGSFYRTDAQAFIVVLTKNGGAAERVKLVRMDIGGKLQKPLFISADRVSDRLDYDFNKSLSRTVGWPAKGVTLRGLGAEIVRGDLSGKQARELRYSTFHTSGLERCVSSVSLPQSKIPKHLQFVVAEKGDILVARVDRNLHEKVALVKAGRALLTDCVFRIRVPKSKRKLVIEFLASEEGRERLRSMARGVGARMISKSCLLDIQIGLLK
jgi:type I restriction enzyme M protein